MTNQPDKVQFVVRPNNAAHPYAWVWLFALLVLIALGIAARFAWMGYWMILPFAVIDMFAVGLVLYMLTRRASYTEKIIISGDNVEIYHIQRNHNAEWKLPLHWTRVLLEPPAHRWYPHRLLVGSAGNWIEIGCCLTNAERKTLGEAIEREIRRYDSAVATEG